MIRKTIISSIRKCCAERIWLAVKSLSLFGFVARGEERPDRNLDILVEFEGRATFDRFMDTKF